MISIAHFPGAKIAYPCGHLRRTSFEHATSTNGRTPRANGVMQNLHYQAGDALLTRASLAMTYNSLPQLTRRKASAFECA